MKSLHARGGEQSNSPAPTKAACHALPRLRVLSLHRGQRLEKQQMSLVFCIQLWGSHTPPWSMHTTVDNNLKLRLCGEKGCTKTITQTTDTVPTTLENTHIHTHTHIHSLSREFNKASHTHTQTQVVEFWVLFPARPPTKRVQHTRSRPSDTNSTENRHRTRLKPSSLPPPPTSPVRGSSAHLSSGNRLHRPGFDPQNVRHQQLRGAGRPLQGPRAPGRTGNNGGGLPLPSRGPPGNVSLGFPDSTRARYGAKSGGGLVEAPAQPGSEKLESGREQSGVVKVRAFAGGRV